MWESVMLVILMEGICELRRWDRLRWYDIHTKFHEDWLRYLRNIMVITGTIWVALMLVLLVAGIYVLRRSDGHSGMIYVLIFMKIGTAFQAILRFCLRNLRDCYVGSIGWTDLWSNPLKLTQMP
jgi:hypothetical protein